jgi:hypothetical protein
MQRLTHVLFDITCSWVVLPVSFFKHSLLVLFEACLLPRSFLTLLILTGDYTMATIGKEPRCQGKERKEKWIWTVYSTPDAKAAGTFQLLKHMPSFLILFVREEVQ